MLKNRKILVVEDDEICRHVICTFLTEAGAIIAAAANAEEGIHFLNKQQFDLVISDIKLPHKSGIDLLNYSKEKFPDMPVILVTGYVDLELAIRALRSGAQDYLLKPFTDGNIIVEAIYKALSRYDLQLKIKALQQKILHHEKFFHLLFTNARDALIVYKLKSRTDTTGQIIKINHAAVQILGISPFSLSRTSLSDLVTTKYQKELNNFLLNTIKNKNAITEITIKGKNNKKYFTEVSSALINLKNRSYILLSLRDITDRIIFEQQVAEALENTRKQMAEELHDVLCQDISSMAILCTCLRKKLDEKEKELITDAKSLESLSRKVLSTIKKMLFSLCYIDTHRIKLKEALEHLIMTEKNLFNTNCFFECASEFNENLNDAARKNLCCIVQEAITNLRKHNNIEIKVHLLSQDNANVLNIETNKKWFKKNSYKKDAFICVMKYRARLAEVKFDIKTQKSGNIISCTWESEKR